MKPSRRLKSGTIVSLVRRRAATIRAVTVRVAGLIGPVAVSGILASLLVLAASAAAFLYQHAKSWGTRGDV